MTHLLPLPWGPGPGPGLGPKNMVQLEVHRPEPQILLFRKLLGTDPLTGKAKPKAQTDDREDKKSSHEVKGAIEEKAQFNGAVTADEKPKMDATDVKKPSHALDDKDSHKEKMRLQRRQNDTKRKQAARKTGKMQKDIRKIWKYRPNHTEKMQLQRRQKDTQRKQAAGKAGKRQKQTPSARFA